MTAFADRSRMSTGCDHRLDHVGQLASMRGVQRYAVAVGDIVVQDARRFLCPLAMSTSVSARSARRWTTTFSRSCDQPLAMRRRKRSANDDVFGWALLSRLLSHSVGPRRHAWPLRVRSACCCADYGVGFCCSGTSSVVDHVGHDGNRVRNMLWHPHNLATSAATRVSCAKNMA